jgi:hypothetical protein
MKNYFISILVFFLYCKQGNCQFASSAIVFAGIGAYKFEDSIQSHSQQWKIVSENAAMVNVSKKLYLGIKLSRYWHSVNQQKSESIALYGSTFCFIQSLNTYSSFVLNGSILRGNFYTTLDYPFYKIQPKLMHLSIQPSLAVVLLDRNVRIELVGILQLGYIINKLPDKDFNNYPVLGLYATVGNNKFSN